MPAECPALGLGTWWVLKVAQPLLTTENLYKDANSSSFSSHIYCQETAIQDPEEKLKFYFGVL